MRSIFKLEKLITNRREKLQAPDFLRSRRRGRRLRRRSRVRHGGPSRPLHPRVRYLGRRRCAHRAAERAGREAGDQGGVPIPEEGAPRVRHKVGHEFALLMMSVAS